MKTNTADGSVQVNPTRSGVTLGTYSKSGDLQQFVPLTWEDAKAAHSLLGDALKSGPPNGADSGNASKGTP